MKKSNSWGKQGIFYVKNLNSWYQKIIFLISEIPSSFFISEIEFSDIKKSSFLILEMMFWYQRYQELFFDIKIFFYIKNWNYWYQ